MLPTDIHMKPRKPYAALRSKEKSDMGLWIIGRAVELPNGHKYMAEPFIAFETNEDAQAACDMIAKVSGERPMIADAAFYRSGETVRPEAHQ
jgi:hypothetical protein